MVDEEKLLRHLQEKRKHSIERAIEIYTPYVSTVIYNAVGNSLSHEDVEEAVADVFISLWKNANYIDLGKGTMRSYIAAVARNSALKKLNRKNEYVPMDALPEIKSDDCTEAVLNECLWDYVMLLGEPDNEIFVRYYRYGERLKEIANATGIGVSTVKTKLSRGRKKLKKMLLDKEVVM